MTATGHAVIGVVIAATVSNPALAIPLALASHVAADLFPHWDTGTSRNKKSLDKFLAQSALDVFGSLLITFLLIIFVFPSTNLAYAYLIVFASQFFDWATAPYLFFKIRRPPFSYWFYRFQVSFDNKLDKPWGIIGQVAILVFLVVFFKLV